MSVIENGQEISEEKQLILFCLHAEEGLWSQLFTETHLKEGLHTVTAGAPDQNWIQDVSQEGNENQSRGDELLCFLRRNRYAPPRPYSRHASWSTWHGIVVLDQSQYATSLRDLSAMSWIRLAFKDGIIGEEMDWCEDGQLWRLIGRGPTHSVDSKFTHHEKYQKRYLINATVVVDYFLQHWCRGWASRSEISASDIENGKEAIFSPVMSLEKMETMIRDIEKDLSQRIERMLGTLRGKALPFVAVIWNAWLDRVQKRALSEIKYRVDAICSNSECGKIKERHNEDIFIIDNGETTILKIWQRVYPATKPAKNFNCQKCGSQIGIKSYAIKSLPSCLAVIATKKTGQGGIRQEAWGLPYLDGNRKMQIALFRWMGGIFFFKDKFRVYWRDAYSQEALKFSMYIGAAEVSSLSGLMISGLNEDNRRPIEGPYGYGQFMSFYRLENQSE